VNVNLGFYTAGPTSETATENAVVGYGGAAGIIALTANFSPKNLGSPDPGCPNGCRGNPINVAIANKYQVETDFVGSLDTHVELRRYYNSQAINSTAFGLNWRSTYDRNIVTAPAGAGTWAQVYSADGRIDSFRLVGGSWVSDVDVRITLAAIMSGATQIGWQVVRADDTTENYNIGGLLTSIVTRTGLATTLTYNTAYQLMTVTGPFGHTLTYTYNSNGNVATVTVPDGGVYSYAYDSHNNLTSVTYPDSKVRQYQYTNSSFVNALTGIVDELGNTYATYAYDSAGRATSTQHAGGADLTTVAYNGGGSVTVTDPNSHASNYTFTTLFGVVKPSAMSGTAVPSVGGTAFSYDNNGFLASKTDYNGNVTHYTHDARGDETSRTEAYGTSLARTISTTWHSTFHLPLTIIEPNRTTTFTYDANGNMATKTVTAGTASHTWTYTYNSNGQVLTAADPNSNVTMYTYDSHGDIASITDASGHQTQFTTYDADGKPLSITDPNGLVTTLAYDARGRLTSRTVGSEVTSYTYDAAGNLTKVTQPDSSYLVYSYDNAHRLTGVTDSLGNSIAYTLDAASNVTAKKISDAGGALRWMRSYTYDAVERLKTEVGASSQTTTYGYDGNGNLTSVTDPLSHALSYSYDALNRRATTVDPNGKTTSYGYDATDHLTSVTDPRSLVTSYTFTGLDNLTAISSPDTGSTTKTYDPAGNVLSSTDANGNTTTYTYDALNRIATASYADGSAASWTYDQGTYGKGHLTTLTDMTGTTAWTYDIHGRVTQKQQTTGSVVLTTSYAYDSYGRLSTVTYPSGNSITLAYDGAGRVNSISSGGSPLVSSITYMPFGQVSGWTEGNGASYSRTIDQDGRISAIAIGGTTSVPGTTTLSYTLDNANRITGLAETGLANKSFGYDGLDRLTSFVNGSATTSYAYDADSNRTSVTVAAGMTTYNYPATSNRLSGLSGLASASDGYDFDGNLLSDGTNAWAYDARGRMASDTVSGVATNYGINALGQRVTKNGTGVSPKGLNAYAYDGKGRLFGEYDGGGNMLEETVYLGNLPIAVLTATGASATYYVNPDHLGAPHIITDGNGNPAWIWDHLAFGDSAPNQNPSGLGVFPYNLRFPGQYADAESGLNYNMARDYSPGLGRYVESDPIGLSGGINTYGYVDGNPVTAIDPTGQSPMTDFIEDKIFEKAFGESLSSALGRAFPKLSPCEASTLSDFLIDLATATVQPELGYASLVYDLNFDVINPPQRAAKAIPTVVIYKPSSRIP
jgi:RHS repeat-associated protein